MDGGQEKPGTWPGFQFFLVAGARLLENVHLYAEPFPLVA
jgi:hypothetical protein